MNLCFFFSEYCPVAWVDAGALVPTRYGGGFQYVAEYRGEFYKMSSQENLNLFIATPQKYAGGASLPADLPYRLNFTEAQLVEIENCSLLGHCAVSLLQSKVMGPAGQKIMLGSANCSVSYKGQIFRFVSETECIEFLTYPEKYADAKLPRSLVSSQMKTSCFVKLSIFSTEKCLRKH